MALINMIHNKIKKKIDNIGINEVILIIAIFFYAFIFLLNLKNGNSSTDGLGILCAVVLGPEDDKKNRVAEQIENNRNRPRTPGSAPEGLPDDEPSNESDDESKPEANNPDNSDSSNINGSDNDTSDNSDGNEDGGDLIVPKKSIIRNLIMILISSFGTIMGTVFAIILPFILIGLIVALVAAFIDNIKNVAVDVWYTFTGLAERLRNGLILGEFSTDEKIMKDKITDKYLYYYENYNIKIDLSLLTATLFYDVQESGDNVSLDNVNIDDGSNTDGTTGTAQIIDRDNDGIQDMSVTTVFYRSHFIDELVSNMISIQATEYKCEQGVDNNNNPVYSKALVKTITLDKDEDLPSVCNAETVGQSIYEKSYVYDENKYMDKLRNTDILYRIYLKDFMKKQEGINETVDNIELMKELYKYLFEEEFKDSCPIIGNITRDLLGGLELPIQGDYNITSYYGYRIDPLTGSKQDFHAGIDVVPTSIVSIYSVAAGTVIRADYEEQGGNVVEIVHEVAGKSYVSQYGHLDSMAVKKGDTVTQGQIIGIMGATGNVTGPHLHFQLWEGKGHYTGDKNTLINTTSLFSGAKNYLYECESYGYNDNCTLEGAIAMLARENGYNFNILRAIIQRESGGSEAELLVINFVSDSVKERLHKADPSGTSEASKDINFGDEKVFLNGSWVPYSGSSNQEARHRVIELVAAVTIDVYDDVAMGNAQIKGSNHDALGYDTSKEMFDAFSQSKYNQVKGMIDFFARKSDCKYVLKNIGSMSGGDVEQAIWVLVNSYRPGDKEAWVSKVLKFYNEFNADPTSTIDNYIDECSKASDADWEDCVTYENKTECKKNLSTYKNKSNELLNKVQSETAAKVLNYALSLWGKVRYCRSASNDASYLTRCQSGYENAYYKQGFKPAWSQVHTYTYDGRTYTAGKSGLDCGGLVTWALDQAFNIYGSNGFDYVLGGACARDTKYTKVTKYSDGQLKNVAKNLKPGDAICDINTSQHSGRHTGFFFGYDDLNGNGILDGKDRVYILHTSTGTRGVEIKEVSLTDSYLDRFNTYFTYK